MSREVWVPLWLVYVVVGLLLLGAVYLVTDAVSSKAVAEAKRELDASARKDRLATVQGCDRNQVQRGYLQLRAKVLVSTGRGPDVASLAPDYFSIVDCAKTYVAAPGSGAQYLSPPLQRCFLNLLARRAFGKHAENVTSDPQRLHVEYDCT